MPQEQTNLFGHTIEEELSAPLASAEGPFAGVALENALDRVLDYSIPPKLQTSVRVGQRVRVPLGRNNKRSFGVVVRLSDTSGYPRIKPLLGIEDDRVLIGPKLMELARWISRYYVTPLGTVLESMIPSAVRKQVGLGTIHLVRLVARRDEVQRMVEKTRAPKRRAVLARLMQLKEEESIELHRLAEQAGTKPPTIKKLAMAGIISIAAVADLEALGEMGESVATEASPLPGGPQTPITLNEDQAKAMAALSSAMSAGRFGVHLLFGVTGSGKTEVYLRCIEQVVATGRQAIVLVPEIALTPQTVRRFTDRFERVAVQHSGLTATQRHKSWQQISTGNAQVVVGARSAVFAPVPNLGVIVVDEEHESSYKQDTAPRYNARDVAVMRGKLEGVPVVLGSATPSLESWHHACGDEGVKRQGDEATKRLGDEGGGRINSEQPAAVGKYTLLTLPARVRGLAMPAIELIDMGREKQIRGHVNLISKRLENLLHQTMSQGRQAILLLNRRGYSNFVFCASCQEPLKCKYCDTTMTYHRSAEAQAHGATSAEGRHTGQLHCHYCLAVNPLPRLCPTCGKKLSLFGLGTQRVEEELARKLPNLRYVRVDSDTMKHARDYERTLARFASGEIQLMLGTQMIAKGLDYPNVTLVGVISGDTALSLPDFRAGERTFALITQVAGRAGRGDAAGRVVLQTFLPDDPVIQSAIKQDFPRFAATELSHRRELSLPPFSRQARIIIRDEDTTRLAALADELAASLSQLIPASAEPAITLKGPMPCPINRIAGYFRYQILLSCRSAGPLQSLLAEARAKKMLNKPDRIAVDVDPVSLL